MTFVKYGAKHFDGTTLMLLDWRVSVSSKQACALIDNRNMDDKNSTDVSFNVLPITTYYRVAVATSLSSWY